MIKLLILDVDGTMTDGKITYSNSGEEFKSFCVKDGLAIATWIKLGKKVALITGRESKIVENRAKELKINYLYQKCNNKVQKVQEILDKESLSWDNVAAIGDDLNDYEMLQKSKLGFTPADGSNLLENVIRLKSQGGNGAVREMIELILKEQNELEDFIKIWVAK